MRQSRRRNTTRACALTTLELEVEQFRQALVVVEAEPVVRGRHRRLQRQERLQLQRLCERNTRSNSVHVTLSSIFIYY